jgi:hypothetical protein
MPRPQFEMIVASAPREKIVYKDLSSSGSVAVNGKEVIDVYSPVGTISELKLFHANIEAFPATLGTHEMSLEKTSGFGGFLFGESSQSKAIVYQYNDWWAVDLRKAPTTNPNFSVSQLTFDANIGLRIRYVNRTDVVTNTAIRYFAIQFIEKTIG